MADTKVILWFRQDLRLRDNPALVAAAKRGQVLPVYILDDDNAGQWRMGAASRWWLHHSLQTLNEALAGRLWLLHGDARRELSRLAREQQVSHVLWNRCYEPWRVRRDEKIRQDLIEDGFQVESFNGALLWEPWSNLKDDGSPYRVFTPYYKNGRATLWPPPAPVQKPRALSLAPCPQGQDKLDRLCLVPAINWYEGLRKRWTPGEDGAHHRLRCFLDGGLQNYSQGRDYPAQPSVSCLSAHLHFGELSPRQVWHAVARAGGEQGRTDQSEQYQRQLAWREFSFSLMYHCPTLTNRNLNERFNAFPWSREQKLLECWQRGETGYPLVDAGMRELWETGYMHNRVRMVAGSFLVKNLLHHWIDGARWFWDCLVDADLASNSFSWQWVAGCGADAAPYFRIFNPLTQSQKFDPGGDYIRRYVPALKKLPDKLIHEPFRASASELKDAGIVLGRNYPLPVVDLKETRERALNAYKTVISPA